jgi:hypothetical protein
MERLRDNHFERSDRRPAAEPEPRGLVAQAAVDLSPRALALAPLIQAMRNGGASITQPKVRPDISGQAIQLRSPIEGIVPPRGNGDVVQRYVQVEAEERDGSVVITAEDEVSEFEDGNEARNQGWNGVETYRGYFKVGDEDTWDTGTINNDYLNAHAGHVLADQNGGLGSDSDNVFAQDGGVNTAYYRSNFEIPMRNALDEADNDDEVKVRVVLYGADITKGTLSRESDDIIVSDEDTEFDADEAWG